MYYIVKINLSDIGKNVPYQSYYMSKLILVILLGPNIIDNEYFYIIYCEPSLCSFFNILAVTPIKKESSSLKKYVNKIQDVFII